MNAAFFDVDGTIVGGDVVRHYAWLRTCEMSRACRTLWLAGLLARVPLYLLLDRFSRRLFTHCFYRNYRGWSPSQLSERAGLYFHQRLEGRLYRDALTRIQAHKEEGHMVVLVTNSLEEIVLPLARHLDVETFFAARLEQKGGTFTGALEIGPLTDREKAAAVKCFARERELELRHCYAYADSTDDLPMMESVGHPRAVNPSPALLRVAEQRGWQVLHWKG